MHRNPSPTKSVRSKPPLSEPELVSQLNKLLVSLHIPIPLISPTDLTPGLLVAILEALMGTRIPVERDNSLSTAKTQNVKIFLGILETDFLQMDVGLSELDPRRLAEGETEEMLFIAELLCWIGRKKRLIPRTKKLSDTESSFDLTDTPDHHDVDGLRKIMGHPSNHFHPMPNQTLGSRPAMLPDESRVFAPTHQIQRDNLPSDEADMSVFSMTPPRLAAQTKPQTSFSIQDISLLRSPPTAYSPDKSADLSVDGSVLSSVTDILGLQPSFQSTLSSSLPEARPQHPLCIHQIPLPSPMLQIDSPLLFARDRFVSSTPPSTPPRKRPQERVCPEHVLSPSCTCDLITSPIRSPPVRYSGLIQPVDEESEIASFELSRSLTSWSTSSTPTPTPRSSILSPKRAYTATAVREEYARTLELLNERAKLLSQLAELKDEAQYG